MKQVNVLVKRQGRRNLKQSAVINPNASISVSSMDARPNMRKHRTMAAIRF